MDFDWSPEEIAFREEVREFIAREMTEEVEGSIFIDTPPRIEFVTKMGKLGWLGMGFPEKYGGSPKHIYVSGHSAGGYLTSMVGLDKRWLAAHKIDANDIAGLIPYSGHTITHFTVRKERGIDGKQPILDDMGPLFHVRKDAPPLLLITGDRELELLGRYEENAYMWRMMQVVEHPDTKIMELDGYNHGQMAKPAHPLLLRFIKRIEKTIK